MKKCLTLILLFFSLAAFSQTAEQFRQRYDRLVKTVGADGVGVEYLLQQWERAFPEDCDMLEGKYTYYLAKSRTEEVKQVDAAKYLGRQPVLTLKDSLGRPVNYFQVPQFSDSLFRISQQCIDKAISLQPDALVYRLEKITALASYEKDSPDMAATAVLDLIDYDQALHPAWVFEGGEVSRADFEAAIQEYCFLFYRTGSPNSYESFRIVSERMLRINPRNTLFLNNMGAYWQVAKRNDKAAARYYKKVLKISPDDASAKANMVIIAKNKQHKKI
jgi:tetratricopeptide (TPR) repeat protein